MKQPDLGIKVVELRQQKNITQEQLAEACEVSTRTIQRIESGEVDPRTYTLTMLGAILEFDFTEDQTTNENLWLAILHLSSIFCIPVIPLLLWSWKKTQSYKIDSQGRQVLNFQITMMLTLLAAGFVFIAFPVALVAMEEAGLSNLQSGPAFMLLVVCAPVPLILTGLFCTYQGVINAMRALSTRPIHYPLSIPFVK